MHKFIFKISLLVCLSISTFSCKNEVNKDKNLTAKTEDSVSVSQSGEESKFGDLGIQLMNSERFGELKLGMGIAKIKTLFQLPNKKSKLELWGADGEYHQEWTYLKQGIVLDVKGQKESSQTVNMITIVEPCSLKSTKQIGIGSSKNEVELAYKEFINPSISTPTNIVAGTEFGGIVFTLENNKVKSIFIGASAE